MHAIAIPTSAYWTWSRGRNVVVFFCFVAGGRKKVETHPQSLRFGLVCCYIPLLVLLLEVSEMSSSLPLACLFGCWFSSRVCFSVSC